jgi:hypothetical protein
VALTQATSVPKMNFVDVVVFEKRFKEKVYAKVYMYERPWRNDRRRKFFC